MCVAVPARIVEIRGGLLPMATIVVGGHSRECCLAYVPEAVVGDNVLVQNGFALEVLDAEATRQTLEAFASVGVVFDEAKVDPAVS